MKIFILLFFLLAPSVYSQELNQNTIIPYLDNLIKSETEIYNYEYKKGKFKAYPLYEKAFLTQKKFNPGSDFLIKNLNMVLENPSLKEKFKEALYMPNFHFALYLIIKAQESKKIDLVKLRSEFYRWNSFLLKAIYYLKNPENMDTGVSFRDYFLIFNYTLPPGEPFFPMPFPEGAGSASERMIKRQHIYYNELNRTNLRKSGLRWKVKVDTIKALKKLPSFKGKVYSGLRINPNLDKKIAKNDILCFGGFLSTSSSKSSAQQFQRRAQSKFLFEIDSYSGKEISKLSRMEGESEILFYPYKKFKVKNIYEETPAVTDDGDDGDFAHLVTFGATNKPKEKINFIHLEEIKDYKGPCKSLTRGNRIRPREYWGN